MSGSEVNIASESEELYSHLAKAHARLGNNTME